MSGENSLNGSVVGSVVENITGAGLAASSGEYQPPASTGGGGGSPPDRDPPDGALRWLDEHLNVIRSKIIREANETAGTANRNVEPRDVVDATGKYAPGERLAPPFRRSVIDFMDKVSVSITGVTIVSALLAIVFGVIGFWVGTHTVGPADQLSSGAFDIAKIFAGAIVGSTTATVAANIR